MIIDRLPLVVVIVVVVLCSIFQWTHIYDEGHLKPDKMYVYIATANAITQGVSDPPPSSSTGLPSPYFAPNS